MKGRSRMNQYRNNLSVSHTAWWNHLEKSGTYFSGVFTRTMYMEPHKCGVPYKSFQLEFHTAIDLPTSVSFRRQVVMMYQTIYLKFVVLKELLSWVNDFFGMYMNRPIRLSPWPIVCSLVFFGQCVCIRKNETRILRLQIC